MKASSENQAFRQRVYAHAALGEFVGHKVRVKVTRGDISTITVSLPNGEVCEPYLLAVQRLLAQLWSKGLSEIFTSRQPAANGKAGG